jgi:uncharacterized protein (TIGR00159 family)
MGIGADADCDFAPMKELVKRQLGDLIDRLKEISVQLDREDRCLLDQLEQTQSQFQRIRSTAANFYLNCYLSPFTGKYAELSVSLRHLADRKYGALIVVQRDDPLDELLHNGVPIGATVSHFLIESIFQRGGPLHDGAVLVRNDTIVSAANVLPLSSAPVHRTMGTRHRAAVGLSEKCDAIVLIVSEETGNISFAAGGRLYAVLL